MSSNPRDAEATAGTMVVVQGGSLTSYCLGGKVQHAVLVFFQGELGQYIQVCHW